VDLVPFKTCTYDCIYCQLGRTTCKTVERKEWCPLGEVLAQLEEKLPTTPDYVTLSGSGEPTLHSGVGELIGAIKEMTCVPVAVLTNGSLLRNVEVRLELMMADLVIPSLDAGDEQAFRGVNRPHQDLAFNEMVDGLARFRQAYIGEYWLEVFLLGGVTAIPSQVEKMAKAVERIGPDRIQLNTVTRPPAQDTARPVPKEEMERLASFFGARVEVIADFQGAHERTEFAARRKDVLDLLSRRPCTTKDIADGLALHRNEVVKYVQELSDKGRIVAEGKEPNLYYRAVNGT